MKVFNKKKSFKGTTVLVLKHDIIDKVYLWLKRHLTNMDTKTFGKSMEYFFVKTNNGVQKFESNSVSVTILCLKLCDRKTILFVFALDINSSNMFYRLICFCSLL